MEEEGEQSNEEAPGSIRDRVESASGWRERENDCSGLQSKVIYCISQSQTIKEQIEVRARYLPCSSTPQDPLTHSPYVSYYTVPTQSILPSSPSGLAPAPAPPTPTNSILDSRRSPPLSLRSYHRCVLFLLFFRFLSSLLNFPFAQFPLLVLIVGRTRRGSVLAVF